MSTERHLKYQSQFNVSIRDDFLSTACLSLSLPDITSFEILARTIAYVRHKYSTTFPLLGNKEWQHVACYKMKNSPQIPALCFKNFYIYSQYYAGLLRNSVVASVPSVLNADKDVAYVPCLPFIIYLYLQNAFKPQPLVPVDESHPSSPAYSSQSSDVAQWDRQKLLLLEFVRGNLMQILELIHLGTVAKSPQNYKAAGTQLTAKEFELDALDVLNYFFIATTNQTRIATLLSTVIKEELFNQGQAAVTVADLAKFLSTKLSTPPRPLTGDSDSNSASMSLLPTICLPKSFHFQGISNRTLLLSEACFVGASVSLSCLNNCHVYVPSPSLSFSISNCKQTKFIIGPVAVRLKVEHCSNCSVSALASLTILAKNSGSIFYLRTPNRPVIINPYPKNEPRPSDSTNVLSTERSVNRLAPLNFTIPQLPTYLAALRFDTSVDFWNEPSTVIDGAAKLGPIKPTTPVECTPSWELLPASEFKAAFVPYSPYNADELYFELPPSYSNVIRKTDKAFMGLQHFVRDLGLSPEQTAKCLADFEKLIEAWTLKDSNVMNYNLERILTNYK